MSKEDKDARNVCEGQPEHNFTRVLGVEGVAVPDEKKKVTFGCTRCKAEETRKGKHIF